MRADSTSVLQVGSYNTGSSGISAVLANYERMPVSGYSLEFRASYSPRGVLPSVVLLLRIVRLIFTQRFRVVHVHLSQKGSFIREGLLLLAAHYARLTTVATIHGSGFPEFAASRPRLAKSVLRHANAVTFLTDDTRDCLTNLGLRRLVHVPNPIAPSNTRKALPRAPLVLFAGAVGTRKGVDVLLDAWPIVASEVPNAELRIAGPLIDIGRDRIVAAGATYLGELSPTDVKALLGESRVAVLPSRAEAMPVFLLEALAESVPIVCTDVGSMPELARSTGALVPVNDTEALADALIGLLVDDERWDRLSTAASRKVVEEYSLEVVGKQLSDLYSSVRGEAHR